MRRWDVGLVDKWLVISGSVVGGFNKTVIDFYSKLALVIPLKDKGYYNY